MSTGGHSAVDPKKQFRGPLDVLSYLPRGLAIAFLAPLPWQWFDAGGRVGILRPFAAIEMVLIYLLLGGVLLSLPELHKHLGVHTAVLLSFVLLVAIPMSLTVANLGTLFRLRLQFLLPLWVVVALLDIVGGYRRGITWVRHRIAR